jgi:peroxiredoxin
MTRFIITVLTVMVALPVSAAGIKTGEKAPDFTLMGADDVPYKLSKFKGKTVVLEWFNNDCPYVRKFYDSQTMQKLQKEATAKGTVWLTVISSAVGKEGHMDAATATKIRTERGMGNTAILLDPNGEVGLKLYNAKTTPHMYIINKEGVLVYQGAIDDRPSAQPKTLIGAQNYVSAALAALEKGEAIKDATTTPYGCSVKY